MVLSEKKSNQTEFLLTVDPCAALVRWIFHVIVSFAGEHCCCFGSLQMLCILMMNKCVLVHCCNIILMPCISFGPFEWKLTETKRKLPGCKNIKLQLMANFSLMISFRVVLKLLSFMQVDGLSIWLAERSSKGFRPVFWQVWIRILYIDMVSRTFTVEMDAFDFNQIFQNKKGLEH